ncbi:hypothetical protein EV2_028845 [Malus domestica]
MQARSVGVAFYARADQEHCAVFSVLGRAGKERLVLPFMLMQTRSVWCCLLCSCRPGALMSPFMLVQIRSVVPCSFRLVQARSLVSYSLGSCGQRALVRAV